VVDGETMATSGAERVTLPNAAPPHMQRMLIDMNLILTRLIQSLTYQLSGPTHGTASRALQRSGSLVRAIHTETESLCTQDRSGSAKFTGGTKGPTGLSPRFGYLRLPQDLIKAIVDLDGSSTTNA